MGWTGGVYDAMRDKVATDHGRTLYKRRQPMIEPIFGQLKLNRGLGRFHRHFHRHGRAAVHVQWRLITATHNSSNTTDTASPPPQDPAGVSQGPRTGLLRRRGGSAEPPLAAITISSSFLITKIPHFGRA